MLTTVAEYYLVGGIFGNSSLWVEKFEMLWSWKKIFIALTVISLCFLPIFGWVANMSVVNNIDEISYEIYLTHKNFILGKLALMSLAPLVMVNITISLFLTYLTSVLVFLLAKKVVNFFPQPKCQVV